MFSPSSNKNEQLNPSFYFGLTLLSFALLGTQMLLTRILSVIYWFQYVFLIISSVMFGLTLGTLIIYLTPQFFTKEKTFYHITTFAYLSSLGIIFGFLSLFWLPYTFHFWLLDKYTITVLYAFLSVPFIAIGICLSLCLSRFPKSIGKIYSFNLIGSALGCLGAYYILNMNNAASAIFCFAAVCALASLSFSYTCKSGKGPQIIFIATAAFCLFFSAYNNTHNNILPTFIKHSTQDFSNTLHSKWNFFSYVSVKKHPANQAFGWGYSPKIREENIKTSSLMIKIDEGAGTVMTKYNQLSDLEYLKLDISALGYQLRNNDDVFIIGPGGGRDPLTAVISGAKNVTGVEINRDIIDAVFNRFHDFGGKGLLIPQIKIHHDEARSFLSNEPSKYNIIQASLIDSWAASASNAFALAENNLYTKDAWLIYMKHLKPEGILTFSRFYHKPPYQIYKLVTMAKSALKTIGVANPRDHIILVRVPKTKSYYTGTILVSRSPFKPEELKKLSDICKNLQFEIMLTPKESKDPIFTEIFANPSDHYTIESLDGNIDPPTDDRPFFFYHANFSDFFKKNISSHGLNQFRKGASAIFGYGLIFILIPLIIRPKFKGYAPISLRLIIYFTSIGLAFMLIEFGLMQRLGIYLGHPMYGLTIVLFSLLLATGIGSYCSKFFNTKSRIKIVFVALITTILLLQFILPKISTLTTASPLGMKFVITAGCLLLTGFFMGTAFPLGITLASRTPDTPLILYWGINGLSSMVGTTIATLFLINFGFQYAMIFGAAAYLAAAFCYLTKY